MHFSAAGAYLGFYPFGWDITAGTFAHDGTYSIAIKENRYGAGSYCGVPGLCFANRIPGNEAGMFATQLDPALGVEWRYRNADDYEWCVNSPAIDRNGIVYMNSEDGFVYAFNRDGSLRQTLQLS